MKNYSNVNAYFFALLLVCFLPVQANFIMPSLVVKNIIDGVFSVWFVIATSILIEAAMFYLFINNISALKALMMSIVGNSASAFIGTIVMTFGLLITGFLTGLLLVGATSLILMYLGSALIELFTIRLFFPYRMRDLWLPVFIGNLITYVLIVVYQLPTETIDLIKQLMH